MAQHKNIAVKILLFAMVMAWICGSSWARYKARNWILRDRSTYAASLTSEGVTIAAEPLYTNALAAQVFDKPDMLSRGIMPLAIVVFNDNDFPIEIDGLSIELIHGQDRIRTLYPNEVVYRLFRKDPTWINRRISRIPRSELNKEALDDFDQKFLMQKIIAPHGQGGGFLYLHIPNSKDIVSYLSNSLVYIPNIYRRDDGSRMIFFEIELKAAMQQVTNR